MNAFEKGFIKRAADFGFSNEEAEMLLQKIANFGVGLGGLTGMGLGGLVGGGYVAMQAAANESKKEEEERDYQRAILQNLPIGVLGGAGVGGLAGMGLGHLTSKEIEQKGKELYNNLGKDLSKFTDEQMTKHLDKPIAAVEDVADSLSNLGANSAETMALLNKFVGDPSGPEGASLAEAAKAIKGTSEETKNTLRAVEQLAAQGAKSLDEGKGLVNFSLFGGEGGNKLSPSPRPGLGKAVAYNSRAFPRKQG